MTDAHTNDDGRDQLSRDVSPGTGYMIWQCAKCSRWHVQLFGDEEPVCLRCAADAREWMATLHRTENGDFILSDGLLHKLVRQANTFEKEATWIA